MRITINPARNLAYIHFQDPTGGPVETVEVTEDIFLDRDQDGRLYGIELLNANEQLRSGSLAFLEIENEESGERRRVELPFTGTI